MPLFPIRVRRDGTHRGGFRQRSSNYSRKVYAGQIVLCEFVFVYGATARGLLRGNREAVAK